MKDDKGTVHNSGERKERPIDRVRKLAEDAGVPFEEGKASGKRTIIFFGSAKLAKGSASRGGDKKTS